MEKLPPEIMDKMLPYFDVKTSKVLRQVSIGFGRYMAPSVFKKLTVFQHPCSEAKIHKISEKPWLAQHVETIRVPSLIYLQRLDDDQNSSESALSTAQLEKDCTFKDSESALSGEPISPAKPDKPSRYKQWGLWRVQNRIKATCMDIIDEPTPYLDLTLFPRLRSIKIKQYDQHWKARQANAQTLPRPGNKQSHLELRHNSVTKSDLFPIATDDGSGPLDLYMSLAVMAAKPHSFEISDFRSQRYWEILHHQPPAALDFTHLKYLTLYYDKIDPLDDKVEKSVSWRLAPHLFHAKHLENFFVIQHDKGETFYDVLELFKNAYYPKLNSVGFIGLYTRARTLKSFLANHPDLQTLWLNNLQIQRRLWLETTIENTVADGLTLAQFDNHGQGLDSKYDDYEEEDLPWWRGGL